MFVYNHQILEHTKDKMPKEVTRALCMLDDASRESCLEKPLSDEYCNSRLEVPYPLDAKFNPTEVLGLCGAFRALTYQPDDQHDEEGRLVAADPVMQPIVALMARLLKGLEDPAIAHDFWGAKPHKLPKLTGTSSDNLVDLPMCVRQQLQQIESYITRNTSEQKGLQVRVAVLRLFTFTFFFSPPLNCSHCYLNDRLRRKRSRNGRPFLPVL